jgi:hypothetical protein
MTSGILQEARQKASGHMNALQLSSERYTDRIEYAATTRTRVLSYGQLFRIADRLRSNAEELVSSSSQPTLVNCQIAGVMLRLACALLPPHIAAEFNL